MLTQFIGIVGRYDNGQGTILRDMLCKNPSSLCNIVTGDDFSFAITNKDACFIKSKIKVLINGSIYNHEELAERYNIQAGSQQETLAKLFLLKGESIFSELNGEFCLAIFDNNQKLYLAVDRVCSRNIYYFQNENCFIFSTEIKKILGNKKINAELNRGVLKEFFFYRCLTSRETLFLKIFKLLPGEFLVVKDNKTNTKIYWDMDFQKNSNLTLSECLSTSEQIIKKAVAVRVSDVDNIGLTLSGGIDSSLIACNLLNSAPKSIFSYCVGSRKAEYDEKEFSMIISKKINSIHTTINMEDPNFNGGLEKLTWILEEPTRFYNSLILDKLFEAISGKITVILSGNGDSIFGSKEEILFNKLMKLGMFSNILPNRIFDLRIFKKNPYAKLLNNFCKLGEKNFILRLTDISSLQNENEILATEKLFSDGINPENDFKNIYMLYDKIGTLDSNNKYRYLIQKTFLVLIIQRMVKLLACKGIENREPFVDNALIDFAFTIPNHLKTKNNDEKFIFRNLLNKYVSTKFTFRKKMGLSVPLLVWLKEKQKLGNYLHMLLEKKCLTRDIFNSGNLKLIINDHLSGKYDYSRVIWGILGIEIWHRVFIDKDYNFS